MTKHLSILLLGLAVVGRVCAQQPWRLVITGDSRGDPSGLVGYDDHGVNTIIMAELAKQIVEQRPDVVLFTGDLVHGSPHEMAAEEQLMKWRDVMQPVYDAGIRVLVVRGNHDSGDSTPLAAWNSVFAGAYAMPGNGPPTERNLTYSTAHKNALIVGFDQYNGHKWPDHNWLESQLSQNRLPHVFVFAHEPFVWNPDGTCHFDDWDGDRGSFWAAVREAGCRTYFCAHQHLFYHCLVDDGNGNSVDDIHQFIAGTAGAPNFFPQYGYLLIEVDAMNVAITWVERNTTDLSISGVYEPQQSWGYSVPCPATLAADINHDCGVDIADLILFAADWLNCGNPFDPACQP